MMKNDENIIIQRDYYITLYDYYGDLRSVDVTIRRIREKIEDNTAEPKYIITKRGIGYYV